MGAPAGRPLDGAGQPGRAAAARSPRRAAARPAACRRPRRTPRPGRGCMPPCGGSPAAAGAVLAHAGEQDPDAGRAGAVGHRAEQLVGRRAVHGDRELGQLESAVGAEPEVASRRARGRPGPATAIWPVLGQLDRQGGHPGHPLDQARRRSPACRCCTTSTGAWRSGQPDEHGGQRAGPAGRRGDRHHRLAASVRRRGAGGETSGRRAARVPDHVNLTDQSHGPPQLGTEFRRPGLRPGQRLQGAGHQRLDGGRRLPVVGAARTAPGSASGSAP